MGAVPGSGDGRASHLIRDIDALTAFKYYHKLLVRYLSGIHGPPDTNCCRRGLGGEVLWGLFGDGSPHHPENSFLYPGLHCSGLPVRVPQIFSDFHDALTAEAHNGVVAEEHLYAAVRTCLEGVVFIDRALYGQRAHIPLGVVCACLTSNGNNMPGRLRYLLCNNRCGKKHEN